MKPNNYLFKLRTKLNTNIEQQIAFWLLANWCFQYKSISLKAKNLFTLLLNNNCSSDESSEKIMRLWLFISTHFLLSVIKIKFLMAQVQKFKIARKFVDFVLHRWLSELNQRYFSCLIRCRTKPFENKSQTFRSTVVKYWCLLLLVEKLITYNFWLITNTKI